ncbi:MAG: VCBS repeat-containing protein [Acidobacteria bacterium]|nr:VCBS repeat-containing protein [Acidobacteriota bacterium]
MSLKPSIAGARSTTLLYSLSAFALVSLITLGIFASNGWLPKTDPNTGKKTGWFGKELLGGSASVLATSVPLPSPTIPLSKEYIYAGSRLLAVEDSNATAVPPADLAVWRPSTGTWYVLGGEATQNVTFNWGMPGDKPVPADFDGDGRTDFSIYRPDTGYWWIWRSSDSTFYGVNFGEPCYQRGCDYPVPADFDGDGRSDNAVWRPSDATWYVIPSSTGTAYSAQWGTSADVPFPGDFDGDGRADFAVWRNSEAKFLSVDSSNSVNTRLVSVGLPNDKPALGDYDGDGKTDHAVWRPSTGTWYIRKSSTLDTIQISWGQAGDFVIQNDYDGDSVCDVAVWRPPTNAEVKEYGVWWIKHSSGIPDRIVGWGLFNDIPVPAFYRR